MLIIMMMMSTWTVEWLLFILISADQFQKEWERKTPFKPLLYILVGEKSDADELTTTHRADMETYQLKRKANKKMIILHTTCNIRS